MIKCLSDGNIQNSHTTDMIFLLSQKLLLYPTYAAQTPLLYNYLLDLLLCQCCLQKQNNDGKFDYDTWEEILY